MQALESLAPESLVPESPAPKPVAPESAGRRCPPGTIVRPGAESRAISSPGALTCARKAINGIASHVTGVHLTVAKPELGTKRHCQGCGAKFYDLNRDPILCPRCGAPFQVSAARAVVTPVDDDEEEAALATDAADIVSLDDVAEQEGAATKADDDDIDIGEEIPDDDEAAFLADDEENDDVSGLIDGDIDSDDDN